MKEPRWVSIAALEILHDEQIAEHGGLSGLRDRGLLESAMARPENLLADGEPDLFDLAAAYAFALVRNHPFADGNKRAGFMAAVLFLSINGFRLDVDPAEAALKTLLLAAGDMDDAAYAAWLREHCETV